MYVCTYISRCTELLNAPTREKCLRKDKRYFVRSRDMYVGVNTKAWDSFWQEYFAVTDTLTMLNIITRSKTVSVIHAVTQSTRYNCILVVIDILSINIKYQYKGKEFPTVCKRHFFSKVIQ